MNKEDNESSSIQNAFQLSYYPHRFADTPADEPSAADIYLFMLTTWLQSDLGHPNLKEFPNVKRIADAVARRPSIRCVYNT